MLLKSTHFIGRCLGFGTLELWKTVELDHLHKGSFGVAETRSLTGLDLGAVGVS